MVILRATIGIVVGIVLPLVVQVMDRRRRVDKPCPWTGATWGSALYAFGPLSMLGWSWVTRPRWWRALWGPLWVVALLGMHGVLDLGVQLAAGAGELDLEMFVAAPALGAMGAALLLALEIRALVWRVARKAISSPSR